MPAASSAAASAWLRLFVCSLRWFSPNFCRDSAAEVGVHGAAASDWLGLGALSTLSLVLSLVEAARSAAVAAAIAPTTGPRCLLASRLNLRSSRRSALFHLHSPGASRQAGAAEHRAEDRQA